MADLMNKTPDVSTPRREMEDIYREVSTARQALRDSYQNLQNVADYCEKNYMEAPDKRKALENTMSLVTQTLASVACQVGVAARHVSDMLEVQSLVLQKEEARVRFVSQLLDIHVEKVARQKIGKSTTAKKFNQAQKIQKGQNRPLASYTRMPINFTSLDNTGHGIMDSDSQLSRTGTMSRKISVKSMGQTHNTLGRNSRVRDPVAPPLIPAQKVLCPISPDTLSPSVRDPPRMNGDLTLPSPEYPTHRSLETDIEMPICKSLESIDECFPPPPAIDNEEQHSIWSIGNGFPSPVCTQYLADDLLPPPAPDYEMSHIFWPADNGDIMDGSTSLDDLPPPPPDF
ncbi:ABI gene family member 3 [Rhinoderma darwinii]|uniref:ABI gene family member 3 n=1 Tax=Rhinoderma darwinii TaxID=43563 RepID=UPI003F66F4B1